MYKCMECGETFDEPVRIYDLHPEVDTRIYESHEVCPYCGGVFDHFEGEFCGNCSNYNPTNFECYLDDEMHDEDDCCDEWSWEVLD